jgi:mannose-6-phosphate isomerase-like protein (cupin superfamily)
MMTRRDALGSLALLLPLVPSDASGQPTQSTLTAIFKQSLPNLTMDDWDVNVNWVDYPPGRVGTAHRHPGFTLAYVLQGSVIAKVTGQEERTFTTGQMFFEPPGSVHEVSKNASQTEPARLLALNFAKKGLTPTTPA